MLAASKDATAGMQTTADYVPPNSTTELQRCLLSFVFIVVVVVVSVVVLPEFLLRNKISERVPRTPSWPAPLQQEVADCKLQVAPCHAAAESNAKRMCTKWHKINAKIRGNNKNNTSSSSKRRSRRSSRRRSRRRSGRRSNEDMVFPGEASRQRQLNSQRRICLPPENKKKKKVK